eukprot:comp15270_c0_seq1/m.23010 comp15270_c0_seq1/g.23010  ORF comp15270_c0_seq1/g.23010 comp15270_c0_seq1/m.23010 type:complete len:193 (+) comp15270_c0_seq1:46-624(+)
MMTQATTNIVNHNKFSTHQYQLFFEKHQAIQGDWESFMTSLPHIETKIQDEPGLAHGKLVFRSKPLPPESQRMAFTKAANIAEPRDLWRVLSRSKTCTIEIPSLGFEIKPGLARSIDTLYNHLSKAKFELETIVQSEDAEQRDKIAEAALALGDCLDVLVPYTILVHDTEGASQFFPDDGIETINEWPIARD